MKVTCAACQTDYDINEAKIPKGGGFFTCRTCGGRVPLVPGAENHPPAPGPAPIAMPAAPNPPAPTAPPGPFAPVGEAAIPLPASDELPALQTTPTAGGGDFDVPTATQPIPSLAQASPAWPPVDAAPAPAPAPTAAKVPRFLEDVPKVAAPSASSSAPSEEVTSPGSVSLEDLPAPVALPGGATPTDLDLLDDLPVVAADEYIEPEESIELPPYAPPDDPGAEADLLDQMAPVGSPVGDEATAPPESPAPTEPAAADAPALADEAIAATVETTRPSRKLAPKIAAAVFLAAAAGFGLYAVLASQAPKEPLAKAPGEVSAAVAPAPGPETSAPEPPPAVEVAALPPLTIASVNDLGYAALRAGTDAALAAPGNAPADEVLWAYYRLARSYGDSDAAKALGRFAPTRPQLGAMSSMRAAALLGAMSLQGKVKPARTLAEKLLRTSQRGSPELLLVAAQTYDPARKPELARLTKLLRSPPNNALRTDDLVLLRAKVMAGGKDAQRAEAMLVEHVRKNPDPDRALRAARALWSMRAFGGITALLDLLPQGAAVDAIAPSQRAFALELAAYAQALTGDLAGALATAKRWHETQSDNPRSAVAWLRLAHANGQSDLDASLSSLWAKLSAADARAQLAAAAVRLAIAANNAQSVTVVLDRLRADDAAVRTSWGQLTEGLAAAFSGKVGPARAAFTAAARPPQKLGEARVELVNLVPGKPAMLARKLEPLVTKEAIPLASLLAARTALELNDPTAAARDFEVVAWSDPLLLDPVSLTLDWADALDRSRQGEKATTLLATLQKNRPTDPRPLRVLAGILERAGKFGEAVEVYRTLVKLDPEPPGARLALAAALNSNRSFKEAEDELAILVKRADGKPDPRTLVQLGRALMTRDEVKARAHLLASLQAEPSVEGYVYLAELQDQRGKADEAIAAYRQAIELDAGRSDIQIQLAKLMLKRGSFEEATEILDTLAAGQPDNAEAAVMLGDALREQEKIPQAVAAYQRALKRAPNNQELLMRLARAQLLQDGKLPQAIATLRRVIKLDPKVAEAHYYLGYALKDKSDFRGARAELEAYLRLAPNGDFASDVRRELELLERE